MTKGNKSSAKFTIPWQADVTLKQQLTLEDAKFIFSQAEKFLNDSVATSETIVSRMNTLITLITGSLIALITFDLSKVVRPFVWENSMITSIVGTAYLFFLAFYSFMNNQPKDYLIAGSLPIDLFDDKFFVKEIPKDDRLLRYYVSEIENYQGRIEVNSKINTKRWTRYSHVVYFLFALPLLLGVLFYFFSIK